MVIASLNSARAKARDARRKSDLRQIAIALEMYYGENGTYVVSGSGYNGLGYGWFSYGDGNSYPKSVARGLVDAGVLGYEIIDPSGVRGYSSHVGYMIQATNTGYTLWASLENPSTLDRQTLNTCQFSQWDGYPDSAAEEKRTNYCISN